MTLDGLVASLAWSGVVAYGAWRLDRRVGEWIAAQKERAAQWSTDETERVRLRAESKERTRVRVAELRNPNSAPRTPGKSEIELPDDLEAHVMTWGDEWARDDERASLRGKYLELHTGDATATWQKVRRAVGIGEMP